MSTSRDEPSDAPPLALTMGDPAGIGPEITLKAWAARDRAKLPPFLAIGDLAFYRATARKLGLAAPVAEAVPETAAEVFRDALPVLSIGQAILSEPGRPEPADAGATIRSIEEAVRLTRAGRTSAVVTNPIAKHVLYEAGFRHPGHTEFLAELAREDDGPAPLPVMMLWSDTLAVVPVTIHIPLAEVPSRLSTELICDTARIVARDLATRFGIAAPRLAIAGLNPHAGEGGAMGREDIEIVAPAVERLRAGGIDATGPLPADTMFHARARARYDVALAMYHDQALIPIKTLAFDEGVNVTLGLPYLRTSPDHGTAFDIAGTGLARTDSLVSALRLAGRLAGLDRPGGQGRPAGQSS